MLHCLNYQLSEGSNLSPAPTWSSTSSVGCTWGLMACIALTNKIPIWVQWRVGGREPGTSVLHRGTYPIESWYPYRITGFRAMWHSLAQCQGCLTFLSFRFLSFETWKSMPACLPVQPIYFMELSLKADAIGTGVKHCPHPHPHTPQDPSPTRRLLWPSSFDNAHVCLKNYCSLLISRQSHPLCLWILSVNNSKLASRFSKVPHVLYKSLLAKLAWKPVT